jgi:hypothetical protein
LALASVGLIFASYRTAYDRTGSLRISLKLFAVTYAFTLAASILWVTKDTDKVFPIFSLSLVSVYTIPLIYSVTVHSLPSTFNDKPSVPAAYSSVILAGFGGLLLLNIDFVKFGVFMVFLSTVVYLYGARVYKFKKYLNNVSQRLDRNSDAFKGLKYYLDGHLAVIILVIVMVAVQFWYVIAYGCNRECILLALHMLTLGFAWLHVAIHAPLMLPVILGLKHAKRYNVAPYILTILASITWLWMGLLSLALILLSFVAMVYVFLKI